MKIPYLIKCLISLFSWNIFFIGISSQISAQSIDTKIKNASSIWYETPENDSLFISKDRMRAGNSMIRYYAKSQPDSMLKIALEMRRNGQKFSKKEWLFHANQKISKYFLLKNQVDSCIFYLKRAGSHVIANDVLMQARYLSNMARAYSELLNDNEQAEYYYLECLRVAEINKLDYYQRFASFGLGDIYYKRNDYLKALNHFFKVTKTKGEKSDRQRIALACIAIIYQELGLKEYAKEVYSSRDELNFNPNDGNDPFEMLKNYELFLVGPANLEEAKVYFKKGMSIIDTLPSGEYFRLSFLYEIARKYQENNKYDRALSYFKACRNYAQRKGNIVYQQKTLLPLAQIYLQKKEFLLSLKFCRKTEQSYQTGIQTSRYDQSYSELYKTFSQNFENLGQLDSALHYLRVIENPSYTLHHSELTKSVIAQYLKFKNEQLNEITKTKKLNAAKMAKMAAINQQKSNYIIGLILLFTIVFSGISSIYLRQKNIFNKELEEKNKSLTVKRDKLRQLNEELNNKSYIVSHKIYRELVSIISFGKEISSKGFKIKYEDLRDYYQLSSNQFRVLKDYCKNLLNKKRS